MKGIEELLKENKKYYDKLEAPEEMEDRLSGVLENKKAKTFKLKRFALVATLLIAFIFTYNYNTFAYYGKRLLGYDSVMSKTLQDLNQLGKGQEIGKSISFRSGESITLDGIMVDDSQLIAFYRIKDENTKEAENLPDVFFPSIEIKGFMRSYNPTSGQGEVKNHRNEIYMVHSFEAPKFYERKLIFTGQLKTREGFKDFSIDFKLDRNKAMGHSIKQNINKKVTIGSQEVKFKNILATNTQTVISGSMASLSDLAIEKLKGEQVRPDIDITLLVNGKVLETIGSGRSTNFKGITFEQIFEPLPEDLKDLKLAIINLTIDKKLKEVIPIEKNKPSTIEIENQRLEILNIEETKESTEITIKSDEDTLFPNIQLIADGRDLKLDETHSEDYEKTEKGELLKIRTLSFKGKGKELQLKINNIHYKKECHEVIDIPIN